MREEPVALVPRPVGRLGGAGAALWALAGPHPASSAPTRRASPPTRRPRPPSRPSRRGADELFEELGRAAPPDSTQTGVSYPGVSAAPKLWSRRRWSRGQVRRWISQGAGFETRPPFLPFWARFCRYFWLFLAISGLGASPGGPGSKLIILRATGEPQKTVLIAIRERSCQNKRKK